MAAATVTTHIAAGGNSASNGNSVCMTQATAMETDVVALEVRLVGVRTTSATLTSQTQNPVTISTPSPAPVVDAICRKDQFLQEVNENCSVEEMVSSDVAMIATAIFIDSSTQTESDDETERGLTVIIEEEIDFETDETVESEKEPEAINGIRLVSQNGDLSINDSESILSCDAIIIDGNDRVSEHDDEEQEKDNLNIDEQENEKEEEDDDDEDDDDGEEECYTYKERIIDFDNLRIIEHVIDNHCKVKRKQVKKGQLQSNLIVSEPKSKVIDCVAIENTDKQETSECGSSSMQNTGSSTSEDVFACRELVTFIDESYSVIDNARVYESNSENGRDNETLEVKKSINGCVQTSERQDFNCINDDNEKDNVNHNVEISDNSTEYVHDTFELTSPTNTVDDNNNMRQNDVISGAESGRYATGNAIVGLVNETVRNCDRTACLNDVNSMTEKVTRDRENVTKVQTNVEFKRNRELKPAPVGATNTTMKAFKSKLTPSAPPFQPAASRIKLNATAASTAASAGLYAAYEQTTTIYYKQQNQMQQQQQMKQNQAQQLLQQSSMLHAYSLSQKKKVTPTQQKHQQHQQQQHMLLAQPQQQQQYQHSSKQQQQKHHQQQQTIQAYCAQHNGNVAALTTLNGASTIPHIHVHAPGTATGISTSSNNATPHATHLFPFQLISLTAQQASGASTGIWPLVEAPFYIDCNGEFRTYCPAHGPPPSAQPPLSNAAAAMLSTTPSNSSTTNITASQPVTALLMSNQKHQNHQQNHQTRQHQHQQQHQQQFQHHQQLQNQQMYTASTSATTLAAEAARPVFLQLETGAPSNSLALTLPQQQNQQQLQIRAGKRGKVYRGK